MTQPPDRRFRLVGIGGATKGLVHYLDGRSPSVLGRDAACDVSLVRSPAAGAAVSRQHAVVEWNASLGWCVYDSGSTNGTHLLKQGIPPTIVLSVPKKYPIEPGDVIELSSPDYQFVFQTVSSATPAVDGATQTVLRAGSAAVQLLMDGHAVVARDVPRAGLFVSRNTTGQLWLDGAADDPALTLQFTRGGGKTLVESSVEGARVNGRSLAPRVPAALRDKDLVTLAFDQTTSFLFVDPDAVEDRRLSDMLLDADRITIGTAADNSCRLADPSLSRHHAMVWREGSTLRVRDLGSANGTVVDNQRVFDDTVLREGSRLWFGRLPFLVDAGCWARERTADIGIDIRFVNVSVELAGKLRLHGVSLGVRQGDLVGLLGPSASGKSTLLRALAGHLRMAGGDIYVNGRSVGQGGQGGQWYRGLLGFGPDTNDVGFVQQIDLLQPGLTVREILQFAARQMGLSASEVRQRTDKAGEECNLGPLMDRVAISGNGQMNLSGGQLKRVCVAIEVLRKPRVLVLDEPTTGQDPKNTKDLMELFRNLARGGVTVLMSTHDLGTLEAFDKVTALCLGHLAYFGPPGQFASYFGADSAEAVYASLPDREERLADASRLAQEFRASPLYKKYCGVDE